MNCILHVCIVAPRLYTVFLPIKHFELPCCMKSNNQLRLQRTPFRPTHCMNDWTIVKRFEFATCLEKRIKVPSIIIK